MAGPTFTVGNATVTRIDDFDEAKLPAQGLLPDWDANWIGDHPDAVPSGTFDADEGTVPLPVHSWLIRDGVRTILVDTGAGNAKVRPYSPWFDRLDTSFLSRLAEQGVAPEDVTHVLLTHLHVDHVGWNTRLQDGVWVPTFPRARHVLVADELAYFTDFANLDERSRTSFAAQQDSVLPIVAAGLADPIAIGGLEAIPGFTFHALPGHSPHHAGILWKSGGAIALFSGDVMHHPVQVSRPEWNSRFDADPATARTSRRQALELAADTNAIVFTAHFGGTSAGRVSRDGPSFCWTTEG